MIEHFPLTLFTHVSPEHVAHVINAACLYSGLLEVGIRPRWVTMNPRNQVPELHPSAGLKALGLEELSKQCVTKVANCAPWVKDEFSPQINDIDRLLAGTDTRCLYMHYYPPFWGPVVKWCKRNGVRVGLHMQNFARDIGDIPFFAKYQGALAAVREADFLTVSQLTDVPAACDVAGKTVNEIAILPKAVPPEALASAVQGLRTTGTIKMTYVGRLERFKNIGWFLQHCLPRLSGRMHEFQIHIVGWGTVQNEVLSLAAKFPNVRVTIGQLPYPDVLRLLAASDLVLFPSGYDYSPRLPLEAILVGTPVLLGRCEFSRRYQDVAGCLVRRGGSASDVLEYSGQTIEYAIPDIDDTVKAVQDFLDHPFRLDVAIPAIDRLAYESTPRFGASTLAGIIATSVA
jgi:glycosyltransferase involved in cell wall biosynthesis